MTEKEGKTDDWILLISLVTGVYKGYCYGQVVTVGFGLGSRTVTDNSGMSGCV